MKHARFPALAMAVASLAFAPSATLANALHQGDIFPAVQAGTINIVNGATIDAAAAAQFSVLGDIGGQKLFSGNFQDLAGGQYLTDDPGFNWVNGEFAGDTGFPNGSLLGFQALGALSFWNGTTWVAAPAGTSVSLDDALGTRVTWDASGVSSGTDYGYIAQSSGGGIHQHLDFRVAPANASAPVGAWLINLSLFSQIAPANVFDIPAPSSANRTPGIADSAAFTLVFNGGLSDSDFDAAIASLTEAPPTPVPVPLPLGMFMLSAGSLLLSGLRGCRSRAAAG
jgi:hypothetical protein